MSTETIIGVGSGLITASLCCISQRFDLISGSMMAVGAALLAAGLTELYMRRR
jgi:hypothetical protein